MYATALFISGFSWEGHAISPATINRYVARSGFASSVHKLRSYHATRLFKEATRGTALPQKCADPKCCKAFNQWMEQNVFDPIRARLGHSAGAAVTRGTYIDLAAQARYYKDQGCGLSPALEKLRTGGLNLRAAAYTLSGCLPCAAQARQATEVPVDRGPDGGFQPPQLKSMSTGLPSDEEIDLFNEELNEMPLDDIDLSGLPQPDAAPGSEG
jgi:hypothetical protein